MFDVCTFTVEETQRIGEALGGLLRRADLETRTAADVTAAIVGLEGPLGSGKTAFVQGLARGLGAAGTVRSPTFTLIYEHSGEVPLHHVDLYRLGAGDMEGLGLEELIDGPGVVAIEWPDRAAAVLPAERLTIELEFGEDSGSRRLRITPVGERYQRLAAALHRCASSP